MQEEEGLEELSEQYESGSRDELLDSLLTVHPAMAARFMEDVPVNEIWALLKDLDNRHAAEIFECLDDELKNELVAVVDSRTLARLLVELAADDRTDLVQDMDEEKRHEVLPLLARAERENIRRLASYEEETAGALMTTDYAALPENISVGEALDRLRLEAPDKETIYYVYVIDENRVLTGLVSLKNLILSHPKTRTVGDIAQRDVVSVKVDQDQEEVAHTLSEYDFLAIPVVNDDNVLVGIVTFDDAMDVIEDEAEEDLFQMASVSPEEGINTPLLTSVSLRWRWLVINLGTAVLASISVAFFESAIAQITALAVMMPIIAGMGGNAGTQTMAVMVRGLALEELKLRESWQVILKEIGVGLVNGAITGGLIAVIAIMWYGNPYLGVIMFLAMVGNLAIAGLFGVAFPVILKWLGADPALASTIFITTATDIGGFVIFLGLATIFIQYLQ
ncbi:MAG: magnesium transporter [Planctomycetota bacterium]